MPFLIKSDLTPPLYPEVIEEITRGDDKIVVTAISNAIKEMGIYLNRFDTVALFGIYPVPQGNISTDGAEDSSAEPTVQDEYLKTLAKDIAAWQLLKLGSPNVNLEMFRTAYLDAIKMLKQINNGNDADAPWPLKKTAAGNLFDAGGHIGAFSNNKRKNHL